jgi:LmbE family N-acetylglucosaminyl deacetylase
MKLIKGEVIGRATRLLLALSMTLSLLLPGAQPSLEIFKASAAEKLRDTELYQALLDLQNPWTVMCVAAHPDDEDGATLTVLRRKLGVHTVSLFSTYGEGGQNATGPELYEELGAIRARETQEASRIQGSEPYFLGLKDFGFSKSADEALRVWGHDEALRRMVLKIRELRPDVVITNHGVTGGHGHHQATGRLVLEAFEAAANPARFPEQLRDRKLSAWQVQRLFVRASYEGGDAGRALDEEARRAGRIITIDRNERDPVRGSSYAEQALAALQKHASQGPWPQSLPPAGWPPVRYRLAREAQGAAPLPAGAQTFLDGLSLPEDLAATLTPSAVKALLPLYLAENTTREAVLNALVSLKRNNPFASSPGTKESARFQLMSARLDHALAVAALVSAELKPEDAPLLIPGTQAPYSVLLHNGGDRDIQIKRSSLRVNGLEAGTNTPARLLKNNSDVRSDLTYAVPQGAVINTPLSEHLYDGHLFGEELRQEFTLAVDGVVFNVAASRRFNVAPPVEIESITPGTIVITPQTSQGTLPLTFRLNNHTGEPVSVELRSNQLASVSSEVNPLVTIPARTVIEKEAGYRLGPRNSRAVLGGRGLSAAVKFSLVRVNGGGSSQAAGTERTVKLVYADARVNPGLRVGYVRSSD